MGDEFTDRYDALGLPLPDPDTMCVGECEGTGWIPVREDDEDPTYRLLWIRAEYLSQTDDGWHFVPCPDCCGTGKRLAGPCGQGAIARLTPADDRWCANHQLDVPWHSCDAPATHLYTSGQGKPTPLCPLHTLALVKRVREALL